MRVLAMSLVMGLLIVAPSTVRASINIFSCEPEWAALAEEIAQDKATIFVATHAKQDPHYIRARPSLIAKARKADIIICSGAGLEVGWLPLLLQKASAKVQPGSIGHLMAADYVSVLEVPEMLDRSMGDLHPEGNPHSHLNPHNITLIARELTRRLKLIDAEHEGFYVSALRRFEEQWTLAIARWEHEATQLKGAPVIVHHKSFTYLLDWLGMNVVASLEPKPGIPPTSAHLEGLLQSHKTQPARAIIRTPYDASDGSEWLARKTGTPAFILPYTVGGDAHSTDLVALFDRTIDLLKNTSDDY